MPPQPGILPPPSAAGFVLSLRLRTDADAPAVRSALASLPVDANLVVGLGSPLVAALGASVEGLRPFRAYDVPGAVTPSTQDAVWAYVRASEPGAALDGARRFLAPFADTCALFEDLPCFTYRGGRDLTGYEDGTENPKGDAAVQAAFVAEGPLAGSSFVTAQRWIHDLDGFGRREPKLRDHAIGRSYETNEELPDAPVTAHVRRAAQESFEPAAFMVRRSMPYGRLAESGLYFIAFGADLDRFDRVMRRMVGLEDGQIDGLFGFSRPVTGSAYWCPPVVDGRLDLSAIGG